MSIKRALLSTSDKTGLAEFAKGLEAAGVEILSTGGTARALREAGVRVTDVSDVTQFPEILGGRVKTLHPAIHAGILFRRSDPEDARAIAKLGIQPIDLVVVNLYPFQETVAKPTTLLDDAIEQIDIGGPSMLRAAAKNYDAVTVVCDGKDYDEVLEAIRQDGATSRELRLGLAAKVFKHTAAYDQAVAQYLALESGAAAHLAASDGEDFGRVFTLSLPLGQSLRYGENPHQRAAFYHDPASSETSIANVRQHQGKQLSYNNILDGEGALEMVRDFTDLAPAAAVIVKHSNPCGIALGETPFQAYERAHACDPDSAFGGIVALSTEVDKQTAERITETFNEIVIAPSFTDEALAIFAAKKNLRVLSTGGFTAKERRPMVRGVVGGVLVTDRDLGRLGVEDLDLVTDVTPHERDLHGMLFAWRCAKWVKSNAIVYTTHDATVGIGAGQMSRVDSANFGAAKARRPLAGCFMASDAFLPFRDSVDAAAKHRIRGIIQPGGSIRDAEVVAAANENAIIMVFTGMRHFRH